MASATKLLNVSKTQITRISSSTLSSRATSISSCRR